MGNKVKSLSFRYGNLPLRYKYIFSHVAVVIMAVILITPASYIIARNQVEKRVGEFSSAILRKSLFIWEAKIDEVVDYFIVQFEAKSIGNYLKQAYSGEEAIARLRVEKALSDIITYKEGIQFIRLSGENGKVYSSFREDVNLSDTYISGLIPVDHVRALRARPFFMMGREGMVIMSKVLYDLQSTEYLGIMTVGFDYDTFSEIFPEDYHSALGSLMVIDRMIDKPILVSSGGEKLVPFYSNSDEKRIRILGSAYLIEEIRSVSGRWELRSYTQIKDIARLSVYAGIYILTASTIILVGAIFLSIHFANRETERISLIKDYARQIASGNLSGHSSDEHIDELGLLSLTLEELSRRISSLVEGLALEKTRLNDVKFQALQFEYSALQTKINPHFLYNTLEMINAMAKIQGNNEISEVIQLLGDLMRGSISRKSTLIPLRDEIDYIVKYLKIQDILHENTLETRLEIPRELENACVPNFILQPIVENAFAHGIEPRGLGGKIAITASREGDCLVLCVEDNGVGMTEEKIHAVMNREEQEDRVHTKMGLASVDRRIRIVYSDEYGVNIDSTPGEGTRVFLHMPTLIGE